MSGVLVDTDVVIDHLRGATPLRRPADRPLFCSVITRAELVAGPAEQQDAVGRLLAAFREIPVTAAIAEAGGRIRRETRIALPDALIAATAISSGLVLSSRNRRDFGRVEGLLLEG